MLILIVTHRSAGRQLSILWRDMRQDHDKRRRVKIHVLAKSTMQRIN